MIFLDVIVSAVTSVLSIFTSIVEWIQDTPIVLALVVIPLILGVLAVIMGLLNGRRS